MSIVSNIVSCGGTTAPTDNTQYKVSLWYYPAKDNKFSTIPQLVWGYFETYAKAEIFTQMPCNKDNVSEVMAYVNESGCSLK
jgi:hypothetical protein